MPIEPVVVDAHSHIFNAEDLPIDGFVKRLSPVPSFLTGLLSGPLDALTSWLAPGPSKEAEAIVKILTTPPGAFAVPDDSRWARGSDLAPAAPGGFVAEPASPVPTEAEVESALERLSPSQERELDAWLDDWVGSAVLDEDAAAAAGFGLGSLRPRRIRRAISLYIEALKLMTRYRYLIASRLASTYPDVALYVPALVDFTAATDDRPATKVRDQVRIHAMVCKLSIAGGLPDASDTRIHPLVPFDPLREVENSELLAWKPTAGEACPYVPYAVTTNAEPQDRFRVGMRYDPDRARPLRPLSGEWERRTLDLDGVTRSLDIVRHGIEQGGFAGVKIYPPSGFLPLGNQLRFGADYGERLDTAMRAFFSYCEVMEVPILTHAAHSNGFRDGYDELAGPGGWELVLAEFPDLRLCLGHFGHLHAVGSDPGHPAELSWPSRFVALIDQYPHVYADVGNSKLPVSDDYRADFVALLVGLLGGDQPTDVQRRRRRRLLYGSDYWMNTLSPGHEGFLDGFRAAIGDAFDDDTANGFFGLNALRWLGFTDVNDEIDPANLNRLRIADVYGDHPPPAWLGG